MNSAFNRKKLVLVVVASLVLATFSPLIALNFASAQSTYSVTINTVFNGTTNGNSVPITLDGTATGFSTPYTFTGLTGTHNFTVPYEDSAKHPFHAWSAGTPSDNALTSITVSGSGSYSAQYDLQVNPDSPGFAQFRYFVTPNDPAVATMASGKNWSDIINWVATNIAFNQTLGDHLQYPNQTLAIGTGVCREYAGLCTSMLLNRGYNAYCIFGNVSSGVNHVWVALELNGILYHFEPQATWAMQPNSASWASNYTAKYFYNTTAFFAALPSQDPPAPPTFSVAIGASTGMTALYVPILMDGTATGYNTPHTFTGLTGFHNFTLPYQDNGSPNRFFIQWQATPSPQKWFTTINVTQAASFTATYSTFVNSAMTFPPPSEMRLYIVPQDPAVISASQGKNVDQIVNFVSSLPAVKHLSSDGVQTPNQTLSSGGKLFTDFAVLCCSMLRSNGYSAYVAGSSSNMSTVWVVVYINGAFAPINAYSPWQSQITSYQADFYVDENGAYWAITPQNSPPPTPTPTPTQPAVPEYPPTFTALVFVLGLVAVVGLVSAKKIVVKR